MDQKVNLRESEYGTIVAELEKMHTDQLAAMGAVIEQIRTTVTSGDIFSTELTSGKIISVLDTISNDIIRLLEQVFQDSEAGVANMIESMMITDSACG